MMNDLGHPAGPPKKPATAMTALAVVALAAADSPLIEIEHTKVANPHWQADQCHICHPMRGSEAKPIPTKDLDEICLRCHDGRKAKAEAHLIGRVLQEDEKFAKPKGWPLVDGRLSCVTCHEFGLDHQRPLERPTAGMTFLRGAEGGDRDRFCANCHKTETYQKLNPHIMLSQNNRIVRDVCLFCHTKLLDRNLKRRTSKVELRNDQLVLCRSCHPWHMDYFEPGHTGTQIRPAMLAYMRAKERLGPTSRPTRELLAKIQADGKKPTLWVLDSNGRILCTTCHNPHQEGLFAADSQLAYRAMRLLGPNNIRSTVRGQRLCLGCHDM